MYASTEAWQIRRQVAIVSPTSINARSIPFSQKSKQTAGKGGKCVAFDNNKNSNPDLLNNFLFASLPIPSAQEILIERAYCILLDMILMARQNFKHFKTASNIKSL